MTIKSVLKILPIILMFLFSCGAKKVKNEKISNTLHIDASNGKNNQFGAIQREYTLKDKNDYLKTPSLSFQEEIQPLHSFDWGYVGPKGMIIIKPYNSRGLSFFEPTAKMEHLDLDYWGIWWDNFLNTIK